MTVPLDFDALRAANDARRRRKEAATPGYWSGGTVHDDPGPPACVFGTNGMLFGRVAPSPDRSALADTMFICAAKNDPVEDHVAELIAEVGRLRHALNEIQGYEDPEQEVANMATDEQRRRELELCEQSLLKAMRDEVARTKESIRQRGTATTGDPDS